MWTPRRRPSFGGSTRARRNAFGERSRELAGGAHWTVARAHLWSHVPYTEIIKWRSNGGDGGDDARSSPEPAEPTEVFYADRNASAAVKVAINTRHRHRRIIYSRIYKTQGGGRGMRTHGEQTSGTTIAGVNKKKKKKI